jgi:hypothetical protein
MNNEPVAYINVEERKLEWAKPITWHTPTIAQMDKVPLYIIPNTEPVAWMSNGKEFYVQKNYCPDFIPLYTHPAKTLTDEEIKGVMALDECWIGEDCSMPNMIAFAKAILKKAQEK